MPYLPRVSHVSPQPPNNGYTWLIRGGFTQRCDHGITPPWKPSRKSHVRQFSRNGVRRGYLVAVTVSTWQWRGLSGCYGVIHGAYRTLATCTPWQSPWSRNCLVRRRRNCHEISTSHFISRKLLCVTLLVITNIHLKVWRLPDGSIYHDATNNGGGWGWGGGKIAQSRGGSRIFMGGTKYYVRKARDPLFGRSPGPS